VQGNLHAGFGSEAVGKGPARRHLANGLPIPSDYERQEEARHDTRDAGRLAQEQL
jgi:hypothetical protein